MSRITFQRRSQFKDTLEDLRILSILLHLYRGWHLEQPLLNESERCHEEQFTQSPNRVKEPETSLLQDHLLIKCLNKLIFHQTQKEESQDDQYQNTTQVQHILEIKAQT